MKGSYLRKLYKNYFSGQFPDGFIYRGHLIYHRQLEYILRGFCFEDSAFETNSFNLYVFVQPLFIPSTYLWFNFGIRLGQLSSKGNDFWWTITPDNEADIMSEVIGLMKGPGLKFLENIQNPGDLNKFYETKLIKTPRDYTAHEALAYALVITQEYKAARKSLLRLEKLLKGEIENNPHINWLADILRRVSVVNELISQDKLEESINLMCTWSNFTIDALRLKTDTLSKYQSSQFL
jgi:hypothetical protein